jgi:transposase
MRVCAELDVGFKRSAVCVVDQAGRIVWRGVLDTHPEHCLGPCSAGAGSLRRSAWKADLMTPWLVRELAKVGYPVVWMDARAAADAVQEPTGARITSPRRWRLPKWATGSGRCGG